MSIIDVLINKGVIGKADVPKIKKALNMPNSNLENVLLDHGVNASDILIAKGEYLGIPTANLTGTDISNDVLKYVRGRFYVSFLLLVEVGGLLDWCKFDDSVL